MNTHVLVTVILSVGKLILHKNKIFTINVCVYDIYILYICRTLSLMRVFNAIAKFSLTNNIKF